MVVAIIGAASLACGVIVVHGPSAITMIDAGAILLVFSTVWNVVERRRATLPFVHRLTAPDRG